MLTLIVIACVLQVAMKHPAAVTACNLDLENLITDTNRSIATLAITTLLKVSIGRERNISNKVESAKCKTIILYSNLKQDNSDR